MDKLKNLYNINSKSKSISKTPAQDRLQSLQKRLQTEHKTKGILPINSFMKESSNQLKIGNYHSIVKNPKNENKEYLQKTSSIQNRLNLNKKQIEIGSSEKQNNSNKDKNIKALTSKSSNSNIFEQKIKSNFITKQYNNVEENQQTNYSTIELNKIIEEQNKSNLNTSNDNLDENPQTKYSTVKNTINSVWESIKNVWNSSKDKNIKDYKLDSIKNETQNHDLLKSKKNKEKYNNLNNISDQKIFVNTNFQKDHNKNDKKNIEPICTKYIRINETPDQEVSNKIQDNEVSMLELNNDSIQNKSRKRPNDEFLYEDCSKKLKLISKTNEDLFENSNKFEIKKNSNLIIPSPNKKISANSRLDKLREQLKVNQSQYQQILGPQLPCSTIVESNINTKNTTVTIFKNKVNNNDDDDVFERFDVVNQNLANLVKNNYQNNEFKKDFLYIVPDTNVFLNNLSFLCDLIKSKLCDTKGSILYIPYIVLQELDKLKMQKNNSISVRAARAVNYLNENFESKNLHFKGQSAKESQKYLINIENPDDQIINCCLQLKSYNIKYILLSNDINLRNKAICNDIICSSKDNLES